MTAQGVKRKLSAILSADVKGYSRLMGEDELATIETLKNYREIMAALIDKFQSRVVDSPGDNVLAEFSSVVDALECSVEIQKGLKQKNEQLLENRRMEFRIGVNLGDVTKRGIGSTAMVSISRRVWKDWLRAEVSASQGVPTNRLRISCR